MIVDRIFDFHESATARAIPDDFGILLTPGNVERVIDETRVSKARDEAAHKQEIDALRVVLDTVNR